QRLALRRVDLARHDRRARFILRQLQLAEARTRTRAQEADVVGDLEQVGGKSVQRAVEIGKRAVACQRLELVLRRAERQAGDSGHALGERLVETDRSVEAGTNGRTALRQSINVMERRFDASAT